MVQTADDIQQLNYKIEHSASFLDRINEEIHKKIVGQNGMINKLIIGLLSNGHILLEGVPGLAKTLAINSLSKTIKASFSRIQFTPDMLPADVIGTMIYNQQLGKFMVRKGPVFANLVLTDEINRAPAKVQSALLEAMQERQVTIGDHTFSLEEPFLVLATQNPIEQEGTYPLPEAQIDRFMLKIIVSYPNKIEEQQIIRQNVSSNKPLQINQVADATDILEARELVRDVYMDEKIEEYILNIVFATRTPEQYELKKIKSFIAFGGSPRASINIALAAKAYAFTRKRGYVIPDDIKMICKDVLRHRIGLTYEAEADNVSADELLDEILKTVAIP